MWEILLPALAGGISIWSSFSARRRRRFQIWHDAVVACGLRTEKSSSFWAWRKRITTWAGPLEVWIEEAQIEGKGTRVMVRVPGPQGFLGVRIHSKLLLRPSVAREIEVGDPAFDNRFHLVGPVRLVSALLDAETRRLMIKVNDRCRPEIVNGQLLAKMLDKEVFDLLPLLLEIGRRFAQPLDAEQRLTENAQKDPEAGVRLQNLLLLMSELPGAPKTVETLRAACSDASPQVRLRAAKGLGAEGRGVLAELAESTADDTVSAQAVSILGRALPIERTRDILVHALRRRHLQTARVCLGELGLLGDAADVEVLAKVMAREEGELAAEAAKALGTTGSPAAEPPLILALQREQADLKVAAANALGRIGSPAAVVPLKEAAERSLHDPDLHKATRQAIAEIQSRLPGASPGQLSLAGADVGNLSLAQADAGQLSLAVDPAGQLDLSDLGGSEEG